MPNKTLYIYCAGGLGRDVLKMAQFMNRQKPMWSRIIFIDDHFDRPDMNGTPVWSFEEYLQKHDGCDSEFIIANGETVYRQTIYRKLKDHSCKLATLIHPNVYLDEHDTIQEGSVITDGNIIGGNLSVGCCVYVSLACVLGHDVVLEDFVTLSHDVNLSGSVTIGAGTYIGTGTVVRDEVKIGKDCIIGMGSLVTKDIPDGVIAYGSPCRVIRKNQDGIVFRPLSKMEISPNGGGGVNYPYNGIYLLFGASRKTEAAA